MKTFDFDDIDSWGPDLSNALRRYFASGTVNAMQKLEPEYVEDAFELLLSTFCKDPDKIAPAVWDWISSQTVTAYHGSRLSPAEISSIKGIGLVMLTPEARKAGLANKLSGHPYWAEAKSRLDEVLHNMGNKHSTGKRVGQVHATLSKAGLVKGFNHYLTHGSEFDQRATQLLLDNDALSYLARVGEPTLITLAVPGPLALAAANHWLALVEIPNVVREVLNSWAFWLTKPSFRPASLMVDCGLIFHSNVPVEWIVKIEAIDDVAG